MQQKELFDRYEATIDKELAAILRECEHYAGADHRYELATLCEEIKTAPAGSFVTLFSDIEESDGDSGCNGDFFASLEGAAYSAALPRLKNHLINLLQEEFSFYA
jgi:hypothetical protein